MTSYLLSIDQGTSSSRAILFSETGDVRTVFQKELKLTYPQDGWVEQDPRDIINDTFEAARTVLRKDEILNRSIAAASITNQRETTVVWDKKTGEPVYNAIVWQDRRTSEYCATLKKEGVEKEVVRKTGLLLDPYFSATKLHWILQNVEGARQRAENGDLLFGTIDTYLLWHLTGGGVHVTDHTNASRTMLYNIKDHDWDKDLLKLFDIPKSMMPEIQENVSEFGQIKNDIFGRNIVVGGVAGDQQSALIGQGCIKPGMVKSTYGTGCFALVNMGRDCVPSKNKLLTTVAYTVRGETHYAFEGSIFNSGTVIQFLRDNLGLFEDAKDTSDMALSVSSNGGVYFVPAFTGLGAPHWNPEARGVICGLTRDSQKAHIVRAALEAQAYQTRDLIGAMESDGGREIKVLRADGGLVANEFMCQSLADVMGVSVEIPQVSESTAWGSACLAGVQAGVFEDLEDAAARWQLRHRYEPEASKIDMDRQYEKWKKAVEKTY